MSVTSEEFRKRRLTAKAARFDVAMTPKEESTEDRLGQNVQDAVEDSLRVR